MRRILEPRRARFESLESRQLLAGGVGRLPPPSPVPHMMVTTMAVPSADVLPGQTFVIGKDRFAATTRNKGMLKEIDLLPADGSDQLAGNIRVEAWANLKGGNAKDGPRKDTYEALISSGSPDWQTDVIRLEVNRPLWVSTAGVSVEYIATASICPNGDTIGVWTELVAFYNLRGEYVDDGFTTYNGAPTLHTIENKTLQISQWNGDKFDSALADQKNVDLLNFSEWWSDGVAPGVGVVTFVASQGTFANITNPVLSADYNWDGIPDAQSLGVFNADKLVFSVLFNEGQSSARYELRGDVANTLAADPHLQVAFDTNGLTATNTKTGKTLRGIGVNGSGVGQIQLWTANAPVFTFVKNPELVVKELKTTTPYAYVEPGTQNMVLDAFTAYSASDMVVTHMAIAAVQGDFDWVDIVHSTVSIWWDTDGDQLVDASAKGVVIGTGSTQLITFDNLSCTVTGGKSTLFEVHANARDDILYGYVRAQFAGDFGIQAKRSSGEFLAIDQIFKGYSDQTAWCIGGGGMG